MHKLIIAVACLAGMAACAPTTATTSYTAAMTGKSEVPPTPSLATGAFSGNFDPSSGIMSYTLNFQGLSGPVTGAHFHGPAAAGQTAAVLMPIDAKTSPMVGKTQFNLPMTQALQAGQLYVNVHTAKYPDGEIRGQINKAP